MEHNMPSDKLELRVQVERELMRQVDAIGQINGWDRTQTVVYMLGSACNRIHSKANVLMKMAGGNPMPLEVPAQNTDWAAL
jgi:uncharacterized protein YfaQ (DUF2300 family)